MAKVPNPWDNNDNNPWEGNDKPVNKPKVTDFTKIKKRLTVSSSNGNGA